MSIVLSSFARSRLFDPDGRGTRITDQSPAEFEHEVNARTPVTILDGYAPFCKLHVHENWTEARCGTIEITTENTPHLRSGYEARTPEELPVLTRWFEGLEAPRAEYLIVILYSREQMEKEGESIEAEWGIVGCLAESQPIEPPMAPITMMRNALGVEEGGSGTPLDPDAYRRSVDYWSRRANWVAKS